MKIAPSILSSDFGKLNEEIKSIEAGSDLIHVDVMDGRFVPNITLGAPIVKCIKSKLPLDVHLMIENPENYIEDFAKAGAAIITIHAEACSNLSKIIQEIKKLGVKAGVALNPSTELSVIEEVLNELDMVVLMTVNPGFGGQSFMHEVVPKIKELRSIMPDLDIEIDGGINDETAKIALEAGANILVAGSFIFGAENRDEAISKLRL